MRRESFNASSVISFIRAIAVQYTNPFRISTRVVSKGNDGTLLLQVRDKSLRDREEFVAFEVVVCCTRL